MNYKVIKLDNRYTYHEYFSHVIEFTRNSRSRSYNSAGIIDFDQARRWFSKKFELSFAVETWRELYDLWAVHTPGAEMPNHNWTYSLTYNSYRIYTNPAALDWFILSNPKDTSG